LPICCAYPSVLQCVAVCCSALQSILRSVGPSVAHTPLCCSVVAVHGSVLPSILRSVRPSVAQDHLGRHFGIAHLNSFLIVFAHKMYSQRVDIPLVSHVCDMVCLCRSVQVSHKESRHPLKASSLFLRSNCILIFEILMSKFRSSPLLKSAFSPHSLDI